MRRSRLWLSHSLGACWMLAAAGLACGQCTWFVPDVPDFDQHRTDTRSVPGLPTNGKMYCVPTSYTNWFAYVANRGVPQAGSLDGPRDWEDNANYDRVTSVLAQMGAFMNTDPEDGTHGGVSGAVFYASIYASGDLTISASSVFGGGYAPSPLNLFVLHQLGAYTGGTYGFYPTTTGGLRGGGHAITFTGVWGGCGDAPVLQFNDPADDGYNTFQSDFRTSLAALVPVNGVFISDSGTIISTTLYRMDITAPSTNFLDATFVIQPASGLFGDGGTDAGELRLVRPFRPTGNPAPATVAFNKPAGTGPVLDAVISPDPLVYYYITDQGSSQSPGLWRLSVLTGLSTRVEPGSVTAFNPTRIAMGRLGDLYLIQSGAVTRYDSSTTPVTFLGTYDPGLNAAAIAYDDKNDTVAILTAAGLTGRELHVFPRTLSGFGSIRTVPDAYPGSAFVQPDASQAGAYFICSDGSGILRRYVGQGSGLVQTDSILHLNAGLTALNVTDANRVVYAVDGVLVEKERNSSGVWVNRPGSRWAGRGAGGSLSLARSRDNFVASQMSGPSFDNLENPTVYPAMPACYANCDNSTTAPVLNVLDFACFLNKFASGNVYANCDFSTSPPELNVLDFACFLNRFASGCT